MGQFGGHIPREGQAQGPTGREVQLMYELEPLVGPKRTIEPRSSVAQWLGHEVAHVAMDPFLNGVVVALAVHGDFRWLVDDEEFVG